MHFSLCLPLVVGGISTSPRLPAICSREPEFPVEPDLLRCWWRNWWNSSWGSTSSALPMAKLVQYIKYPGTFNHARTNGSGMTYKKCRRLANRAGSKIRRPWARMQDLFSHSLLYVECEEFRRWTRRSITKPNGTFSGRIFHEFKSIESA